MRIYFLGAFFLMAFYHQMAAQQGCTSFEYQQNELRSTPALKSRMNEIENFIQKKLAIPSTSDQQRGEHLSLVTIPVVVHILYNSSNENISDKAVADQLKLLNECFRRLNADSVNTPERFRPFAADCDIEFKLAIADPQKRATTGIIRKYTPVSSWDGDDKMKFYAEGGDEAWDTRNYLNIWVCNIKRILGYATFPGSDAAKDGIVINYGAFGINKTLVHETGHWLGLKHIWGDEACGDDLVSDTPKQSTFTSGCPSGIRLSCSSGAAGDMYMNYMDFTNDGCINLFTEGQKMRMRAMLTPGGARYSILSSGGLSKPQVSQIPLPEQEPQWYFANFYPNPAGNELTLDVSYDVRWIGKFITVSSVQGMAMMQIKITGQKMRIDISKLKQGVYFISGKREDGVTIKQKLIKL